MSVYRLPERELYILPSPAGAYYSVSGTEINPTRRFIRALLSLERAPLLTVDTLMALSQTTNEDEALQLLHHLQKLGWLQGMKRQPAAPTMRLEEILPQVLPVFSAEGKALLADAEGFYIDSSGFPHETAEELSGLSANIASLHERFQGVLENNLGEKTNAWGLIDAAGNSHIGFWPMFIGTHRFVLVIGGLPQMNKSSLITLIWALSTRYGDNQSDLRNIINE